MKENYYRGLGGWSYRTSPQLCGTRISGTDLAVLKADLQSACSPNSAASQRQPGNPAMVIGRSPILADNRHAGEHLGGVRVPGVTWRGGRLDPVHPPGRPRCILVSSGGAVIDTAGQTLGIATSKLSPASPVLAIPVSTVKLSGG